MIDNDDATLTKVLDSCGVTEDEYIQTLKTMRRRFPSFIRESLMKR